MLKHFKINTERNRLIADVAFYQMDLRGIARTAAEQTADPDLLPSWSKFNAAPAKAKGFFVYMLQAIFEGKHDALELNSSYQWGAKAGRVAMMFFGGIDNKNLVLAAEYAQEALNGFTVVLVNSEVTDGSKAEKMVKEKIEKAQKENKNVLIVASRMAQRSFSIGEISELYLAYDGGEEGATIQKMSRALTPHKEGKIGRIISLSFDPNRDDKFDAMIIQTAVNYRRNHNIVDMHQAMIDVLRTIDIFRCTDVAAVKINADEYLEQLYARKTGLNRVLGKTVDMSKLDREAIEALASGTIEYFRTKEVEAADKGKTRKPGSTSKRNRERPTNIDERAWERIVAKARETIVAISENVDILIHGTGATKVWEALDIINTNPEYKQYVATEFGVDYSVIDFLFRSGAINEDLLELVWKR